MDLGSVKAMAGVVTQPCHYNSQKVTSYTVQVSSNGNDFEDVDCGKVFTANKPGDNADVKVENKFTSVVRARFVKIVVKTWVGHIRMRAAVLLPEGPCGDYLDETTDPGHTWSIKAVRVSSSTDIATPELMRSVCQNNHFTRTGCGVERKEAWLVAKRYMWATNFWGGNPPENNGPIDVTAMPMMKKDGKMVTVCVENPQEADLPPNREGDRCDQNAQSALCGQFEHHAGWDTDDTLLPDPVDWYAQDWSNAGRIHIMCMQEG